jgi:ABC-type transport system involved in multi-copper enzyme maturation permease subunit
MDMFLALFTAVSLAGSGIQTASTRPGASEKMGDESTLFTLSLPVTRAGLFVVRTVTGVFETVALLTLFSVVTWLLVSPLAINVHDALGYFAVMVSCSLIVYGISALLSTFCDEGWRYRICSLGVAALFTLGTTGKLPPSINVFRPLAGTSPLVTHQIPWETLVIACVLAFLFLGAALTVTQRRDY